MKLLVDGKEAFPEIVNLIRNAKKSIYINMFIWRNDDIGRALADELLKAAKRGVNITISKDRYGAAMEYCEECRSSFFHKKPTFKEYITCFALKFFYGLRDPGDGPLGHERPRCDFCCDPGDRPLGHEKIKVEAGTNKYDHSKFYVFDDSTIVLGGINIEDKELTNDYRGLSYHDYMVEITEPEMVDEFKRTILSSDNTKGTHFVCNRKYPVKRFEMRDAYLRLIKDARESIVILMAYISPLPDFEEALLEAALRGVSVKIVIPCAANFQDDLNKKSVMRLVAKSGGAIKAYLYPNMLHAKLVMNEKSISVGSCNINKKAFELLDELNVLVDNDGSEFAESVLESVEQTISESMPITDGVKYSAFRAFCESLIM